MGNDPFQKSIVLDRVLHEDCIAFRSAESEDPLPVSFFWLTRYPSSILCPFLFKNWGLLLKAERLEKGHPYYAGITGDVKFQDKLSVLARIFCPYLKVLPSSFRGAAEERVCGYSGTTRMRLDPAYHIHSIESGDTMVPNIE